MELRSRLVAARIRGATWAVSCRAVVVLSLRGPRRAAGGRQPVERARRLSAASGCCRPRCRAGLPAVAPATRPPRRCASEPGREQDAEILIELSLSCAARFAVKVDPRRRAAGDPVVFSRCPRTPRPTHRRGRSRCLAWPRSTREIQLGFSATRGEAFAWGCRADLAFLE